MVTLFPVKPWTPEKISGMLIVSRPIRCEMKPQKITAKPQHWLVTTWHETTSCLFLPRQIFNFTVFKNRNCSFCISAYLKAKKRCEWYVSGILFESDVELSRKDQTGQTGLDNASESKKYGAPNQSIFPPFSHGLFDLLYAQLTFYMLNSTFYMAN